MGAALVLCAASGCQTCNPPPAFAASPIPREQAKVSLPTYVVEPPDILAINAVRVVPLPPYHAQPLDVLQIQVDGVFVTEPIVGLYQVSAEGTVNLGVNYGTIKVVGLTLAQIKDAIEERLKGLKFTKATATVSLAQYRLAQQIIGEHLVRPDGTVGLGLYGSVRVTGLTLAEVRAAIEAHLSQYIQNPEISVDVLAYNSKVIYLISDGAGSGQSITRFPVTGNDTVLEVMGQAGGLAAVASAKRIWVARPAAAGASCDQILPVDWDAITMRGRTETNYQLLPGDRLYVAAQPLVAFDIAFAKLIAPIERITGVALLGNGLVQAFRHNNSTGSNQ
jgi:polysaccharide export outer membrane protein